MGGDDDMMLYMAFLIPFNEFDRRDQADQLGLNPDLLAKFPQGPPRASVSPVSTMPPGRENSPSLGGLPRAASRIRPSRITATEAARIGRAG